nr:MAG TPA: hypothetical protein [Caudoviricetes sp.]
MGIDALTNKTIIAKDGILILSQLSKFHITLRACGLHSLTVMIIYNHAILR